MDKINNLNFEQIYHDIIECLVGTLEAKDPYTSGHSNRVAKMAYELARELGINGQELENIHIAAHLHDIGKVGIPNDILNKSGKLLPEEWDYIKQHPEIGWRILGKSDKLKNISNIVLYHHERWDGNGYIHGLKGDKIPLGSRIITICDAIDAMTSTRSYRQAMSWDQCRDEIIKNNGKQFDPALVDRMDSLWSKWKTE